jgi:hypothetical protein
MRLSERAVFYALLERSDNGDCSIPAHMTPSLVQLAEACCCSKSTVALALNHLEWHGITRKRSKGGRSRKTAYQLADGFTCPPDCQKQAGYRSVSEHKQAGSRTPKWSDSHPETRRSDPVSDVGIGEGEDRGGEPLCIGGCGKPPRHGCSTCWEHAPLELAL